MAVEQDHPALMPRMTSWPRFKSQRKRVMERVEKLMAIDFVERDRREALRQASFRFVNRTISWVMAENERRHKTDMPKLVIDVETCQVREATREENPLVAFCGEIRQPDGTVPNPLYRMVLNPSNFDAAPHPKNKHQLKRIEAWARTPEEFRYGIPQMCPPQCLTVLPDVFNRIDKVEEGAMVTINPQNSNESEPRPVIHFQGNCSAEKLMLRIVPPDEMMAKVWGRLNEALDAVKSIPVGGKDGGLEEVVDHGSRLKAVQILMSAQKDVVAFMERNKPKPKGHETSETFDVTILDNCPDVAAAIERGREEQNQPTPG